MVINSSDLAELRAQAEEQITEGGATCIITRPGNGASTMDPTSLQYTGPGDVTVYEGGCLVQDAGQIANASGGISVSTIDGSTQGRIVKLPVDASVGVRQNDVVEITANPADAELVGRKFTVRGLHHKTMATTRRLVCTEGV
ncbi:MAG: hypothetical protein H6515_14295 [Microthrixaceae bacterium]|nr:hypothetical protein [Microthrixaceae bacterium]